MKSASSEDWKKAMDEKVHSINNQTFTAVTLSKGTKTVGGKWAYAIMTDADAKEKYKARFVAKGHRQIMGINYGEIFTSTANMTSVNVVIQKVAQKNLILGNDFINQSRIDVYQCITIYQEKYQNKVLQCFNMQNCRTRET